MRSLLWLCLVAGCATSSSSSSSSGPTTAQPVVPKQLLASLERGPCFGACPVYKVEVFEDGAVVFTGGKFSGQPPRTLAQLTPTQLAEVRAVFSRHDFASMKDYQDARISDLPWVFVSNGVKTVRHYTGDQAAPVSLVELESELDVLLETAKWIGPAPAVDR